MKKRRFFINSLILTSTSLLVSGVGFSFNVYISNKIGAAGVGLFQLIMSLYGFSVTLATSGINLAAVRLVSEELASGSKSSAMSAMQKSLLYALFFGLFSSATMFFGADFISQNWLCDTRALTSLKILSLSMLPIAFSSAISGYFTAVRRIIKSSSAQLVEQAVKISLVVFLLSKLLKYGIEYACIAIIAGGTIAEIISFIYIYMLYFFDKRKYGKPQYKKGIYKRLFGIALPIAFSTYIRSALVTIEHMCVPYFLQKSGMDRENALSAYGTVHGMAMSALIFPAMILKSFSVLLVPELSEFRKQQKKKQINHIASKMIRYAMLFSACAASIFFCFATDLGKVLYKNEQVGIYIRLLAPLTFVMYVDGIVDGMLKGLNQQLRSMSYNIIDSAVSIVLIFFLLPKYGTMGYIVVIYISELLNGFLSLNRLLVVTDFKLNYVMWIFLPIISGMTACTVSKIFFGNVMLFSAASPLMLILKIITTILFYVLLILLFSPHTEIKPLMKAESRR